MKKTNVIDVKATVNLDELREQLQSYLTPKQLAQFAFDLGEDYTSDEEFLKLLRDKLNKIKFDE